MAKVLNIKGSLVEEYGAAVVERGLDNFAAGNMAFESNPEDTGPNIA